MKLRLLFLFFGLALLTPAFAAAQTSAPIPACSMSLTPWSITKGGSITLKWSSSNTTAAVIPGPGLGNVETNGQRNLIPIRSTRYVGTFTGAGGKATCEAVVTVLLPDGGATVLLDADDPLYFDEPDEVVAPGTVPGAGTFNKPGTLEQAPGLAPAPTIQPGAPIQLSNKAGKGLLPCTGINCQMCHLATLAQNIINFLIGLSIPLAAALFAYAGFIYFSSSVVDKIAKARKIFTSVLIGFGLVAGGWLIVQTILSTILSAQYQNWNKIDCVLGEKRNTSAKIEDLLGTISILNNLNTSPQPKIQVYSPGGSVYSCDTAAGYTLVGNTCRDSFGDVKDPILTTTRGNSGLGCPDGLYIAGDRCYSENGIDSGPAVPVSPSQFGKGDCSVGNIESVWGSQAPAMSCIAQGESGCRPGLGSGIDRTLDGQAFSYGLYQVNMSVRSVQCSNFNGGTAVNCKEAFEGTNYKATVRNQETYDQCRVMLQDSQCNTEMAKKIYEREGLGAWRNTAKNCGLI